MSLTDLHVRRAQAQEKPYKLADEKGLYVLVNSAGKYWRFDYRFGSKRKTLALGVYPEVTLAVAREKRDQARRLIAADVDPALNRKAQKFVTADRASNSFEVVAREWFAKYLPTWHESHGQKIIRRLERDIFPWIGSRPIADINAPEILDALRRIESRGAVETAHRAHQNCGQIFRYAVATGRASRDPSADLRGAIPPGKLKHHASITEVKGVRELMRAIEGYRGNAVQLSRFS